MTISIPPITTDIRLSEHFKLCEFLNLAVYPDNIPNVTVILNLAYGCNMLLETARCQTGPLIVTSGYRNYAYNKAVGGVAYSQHTEGKAADIKPANPADFQRLVSVLRRHPLVDQLLTGPGWLHVSWQPLAPPRRMVRLNYYQ